MYFISMTYICTITNISYLNNTILQIKKRVYYGILLYGTSEKQHGTKIFGSFFEITPDEYSLHKIHNFFFYGNYIQSQTSLGDFFFGKILIL